MKVVLISNFSSESVAEVLLGEENLSDVEAAQKALEWNDENASGASTYYAVVKPDNYVLWRGMADLV